ncbi:MAG: polyphosphate polymerase domain-containing protein [Bacteroidota bacterium]
MKWDQVLNEFERCRLEDLPAELVYSGRKDIKYPMNTEQAIEVLSHLDSDYRVMSYQGTLVQHYCTDYFDTPDFVYYLDHHRGKLNREKQRRRTYQDGTSFWEVKRKNNRGQTIKTRNTNRVEASDGLIQQLHVEYDRITLFSKDFSEKITVDVNLCFSRNHQEFQDQHLIVMESKGTSHHRSPFNVLMRELHIRPNGFSKYCVGMALLFPSLKSNNFKQLLRSTLNV